jgi:DNA-binding MarR family transcriptional regulator
MSENAGAGPAHGADVVRKAEIVRLLIEKADASRTVIASTMRDSGVPNSTSDMLWALATIEVPMTLREIAAKLGRDPSTMTLVADKLEAANLIARRPHPTDGRKRTLVLTDHGHALWDTLRARLHDSRILAGLTTDQQHTLLELLRQLR